VAKSEIRREAVERQGSVIYCNGREFHIEGDQEKAVFQQGGEGLVHRATDESTGAKCRIKCFWEPDQKRFNRSEMLVQEQLADLGKDEADALGGAPFEMLESLGPLTPFAVVMKDVKGFSWKDLKENSRNEGRYPPRQWPSLETRAVWAYGLATAVQNMERRSFIHADLSDGNVMVTPSGPSEGDMALVDFDSFVHPKYPHLDSSCKGTPGYAAPEIWHSESVDMGSDRVGMAILIQEFIVYGDSALSPDDAQAFLGGYDQEGDICKHRGEVFPHFSTTHPDLATLLEGTLKAGKPADRPGPDQWRPYLRSLALGAPLRKKLVNVAVEPYPVAKVGLNLRFADTQKKLDLLQTGYGIRASLERNNDGSLDALVNAGALVQVRVNGKSWRAYKAGERVHIIPGTILFDEEGKCSARILGTER
jgi:serine/threonine protein kinase